MWTLSLAHGAQESEAVKTEARASTLPAASGSTAGAHKPVARVNGEGDGCSSTSSVIQKLFPKVGCQRFLVQQCCCVLEGGRWGRCFTPPC